MDDTSLNHWADRRVFVTGYSGFVGSWLTALLLRLGARVTGYAHNLDPAAKDRAQWLSDLGATAITADIRDFPRLSSALAGEEFDVVVHLAAQPLVSVGHEQPRETLETNLCGSINVLEAARLHPPRVLLHVTSDKCYRNKDWPWPYREVDELGGGCPYSVSKAAAELVFESYAVTYRTAPAPRAASVRFGNIIGGGDVSANRLVPDCLEALAAGRPIQLRHPDAVRPWQHVLDVAQGLLLLADGLAEGTVATGEVFNFAPPGDGATTGRLAAALATAYGGGQIDTRSGAGFPEDRTLRLDGRKAAAALRWRHRFGVEEAASHIVAWHRAVLAGGTPRDVTLRQVEEFIGAEASRGELS